MFYRKDCSKLHVSIGQERLFKSKEMKNAILINIIKLLSSFMLRQFFGILSFHTTSRLGLRYILFRL